MTQKLKELIDALDLRLHQLQYDPHTIVGYHRYWNQLIGFMNSNGFTDINEDVANQYCYDTFGCSLSKASGEGRHCRRAISVLLEFKNHGVIYRRMSAKVHVFSTCYQPAIGEFMSFIESTMARTSCRQFRFRLEQFLGYLEEHGCTDFQALTRQMILDYWDTRSHLNRNTRCYDSYALRKFFDFLFERGYSAVDYSVFVPFIKGKREGQIPSHYTIQEISKLISCIDRSNPTGKRNYAIILLAVCYGMRAGDIRDLKLSDIDWNKSSISFTQNKVTESITLPLLDCVATALVDYFQNGRPETVCRNVFVRHNAPYEAFSANDNLHQIASKYMKMAGLTDFNRRKWGLHSLRHSLAGNLLDNGIPLPTVSSIMGHSSTETTMIYTKIETLQLKSCALEVD